MPINVRDAKLRRDKATAALSTRVRSPVKPALTIVETVDTTAARESASSAYKRGDVAEKTEL